MLRSSPQFGFTLVAYEYLHKVGRHDHRVRAVLTADLHSPPLMMVLHNQSLHNSVPTGECGLTVSDEDTVY